MMEEEAEKLWRSLKKDTEIGTALVSIAISLKRLADEMDGNKTRLGVTDIMHSIMEQGAPNR